MTFARCLAAALALALPAAAGEGLAVSDAYAFAATPAARAGAAYFVIENGSDAPDRLISVETDAAERAEIHSSRLDADGVMRMVRLEDGIAVEPGETHVLESGGDHVMLFGLKKPLIEGDVIVLTLTFERAGQIVLDVPVDLVPRPGPGAIPGGG